MAVFVPTNEADAARIVAEACVAKQTLSIEGNGSKRGLGRLSVASDVLKLSGLSGIVAYEPEELVITVRAGTPLAEVRRLLAGQGQCLAFEPGSWSLDTASEATIGGTIAAGVAGSRRVVMGGARDHLIGFRAINGEGNFFKAGGRVVKNVTGYDLPKLAAGSFGTLFAMTELTMRTYPRGGGPLTLLVHNLDIEAGCALLRRAVASPFEATGFCYLPRNALERLDLHLGREDEVVSLAAIRFEGSVGSVEYRSHACREAFAPGQGSMIFDAGSEQEIWEQLLRLKLFERAETLWRVSVPPASAPRALAALSPECFVVDWAGGLLWLENPAGDVHAVAQDLGGHAMLFRAPDEMRRTMPVFSPRDEATMALTRRLKAAFDPAGVFNPGRMYAGI